MRAAALTGRAVGVYAEVVMTAAKLLEELPKYVNQVTALTYMQDTNDLLSVNQWATMQCLVCPLFTMLGYELTDPKQSVPEYCARKDRRSAKWPADWVFWSETQELIIVEAKPVPTLADLESKKPQKLDQHMGQLRRYYSDAEGAAGLGIITNGNEWLFFTDSIQSNIMDGEPFFRWNALNRDEQPVTVLEVMERPIFESSKVRALARRIQRGEAIKAGVIRAKRQWT